MTLLNHSNHNSSQWSNHQKKTTELTYSEVIDLGFPRIDPKYNCNQIIEEVDRNLKRILDNHGYEITVLIAGEQSYIVSFVMKCKELGIPCIAATSHRMVKPGWIERIMKASKLPLSKISFFRSYMLATKVVTFKFIRYRKLY